MDDNYLWIAIEMDCLRPANTKARLILEEKAAMWLGDNWLVFEKLPGIAEPKLVPYEQRVIERET